MTKKLSLEFFVKVNFLKKKEKSYFFIFITLAFFAAFRWLGRREYLEGLIVFGETSYK